MSSAELHHECPIREGLSYWQWIQRCKQTPLYIRESFEVENPTRAYRRRETKRKWKRVGVICLACSEVTLDEASADSGRPDGGPGDISGLPESPATSVDQNSRSGLPVRSRG